MDGIAWHLLQPVDTGAQVMQGFQTGMALTKGVQTRGALNAYLANPDDPQAYGALASLDPQMAATLQQQMDARKKALRETQDRERAVALGELAVDDPAGAREEALKAGDFDLAEKFGKLSDDERKRTVDFWAQAAPLAYKLRQISDPEQRKALYREAQPILQATGADQAQLQSFDPTNDTALDAVIATGQKISDLIDQGKVTWRQKGEFGEYAIDFMGRPVGSQNPYAGGTGGGSGDGGAADAGTSAVATTLSSALPAPVVAGFLGNFHAEGGYDGAKGDGGSAAGIAQWRGDRQANFQRVIGKPVFQASPEEQARFVLWEMQNPEAAGMTVEQRDAILAAPDAATAADLIDRFYERSSGEHRAKRVAAAQRHASNMGAPVRVASKAEFDKLPSGTVFIAPDGSHRRKP